MAVATTVLDGKFISTEFEFLDFFPFSEKESRSILAISKSWDSGFLVCKS